MIHKVNILDGNLRKISLIIYLRLKHFYKHKQGRNFKTKLLERVVLTCLN